MAIRKDIESSYQIVRTAVEELAGAGGFSLDALNNRLKGAASDTVNTMFRAKIAELEKAGRIGNMLIYDNVLKGLERFAGMRIRFDVITVAWLGKYADFMRKEGKRQTTIAITKTRIPYTILSQTGEDSPVILCNKEDTHSMSRSATS